MSLVANLYKSVPHSGSVSHSRIAQPGIVEQESEWERRRREEREAKEDSKRKAKEAKEVAKAEEKRRKEEELRQRTVKDKRKRPPFDFEKEKPVILQSIAETSQAANNLVNALTVRSLVVLDTQPLNGELARQSGARERDKQCSRRRMSRESQTSS